MYKTVLIFFLVCFLLYLPFSRQPDFFDSNYTQGKVVNKTDSKGKTISAVAFSTGDHQNYSFDPAYVFNTYANGQKVKVIYESSAPQKAAVYRFWGYWLGWKELLWSIVIYTVLLFVAMAITHNPSAEAIKELEEYEKNPPPKRRKYNGNTF